MLKCFCIAALYYSLYNLTMVQLPSSSNLQIKILDEESFTASSHNFYKL